MVVILGDLFTNLHLFLNEQKKTGEAIYKLMVLHYIFLIPRYYYMLGPYIILMASLFTIVLMKKNRELQILMASGISLARCCLPLLGGTLLLSFTLVLDLEVLLQGWPFELPSQSLQKASSPSPLVDRNNNIVYGTRYFSQQKEFLASPKKPMGLIITQRNSEGVLTGHISAKRAWWKEEKQCWVLEKGWAMEMDRRGHQKKIHSFDQYFFYTDLRPLDFESVSGMQDEYLSVLILWEQYHRRALTEIKAKLYYRMAYFLQPLILVLLGVPLLLQRKDLHPALGVILCLLLSGLFFAFVMVFQALGTAGIFSPLSSAWVPYFVFAFIGVEMYCHMEE